MNGVTSERPVQFGQDKNLVGIINEPPNQDPAAPAVILLNAGLLHRVGPNRLHVEIARRVAIQGFTSCRFDMSGVGDSELAGSGLLDIERSVSDVVEAMDMMREEVGVERFVLMGLCTGAYNSFRAALADTRVVGCALLDGYSYPTRRSKFEHYRTRVLQIDRWTGYVKRRLGSANSTDPDRPGDLVVFENEHVPRERFERELASLVDRGAALLLVYTGRGPLAYYYERQIHEAFPNIDLDAGATVKWYPSADHTFTLAGNRLRLLDDIDSWMADTFRPQARVGNGR